MHGHTHGQKALFEQNHEDYYGSLHDDVAEAYLAEFVYQKLLELVPGDARSVLEIASGSGHVSAYLRRHRPDLEVMGSDISEKACVDYERTNHAPCLLADLTEPTRFPRTFDCVIVGGGIHHLVTNLDVAMENIAGALVPGGVLIMVEPNADYVLEPIRRIWYRLDRRYFEAQSEHALSHGRLVERYRHLFSPEHLEYGGGPSIYLLVHSMFVRLPKPIKGRIAAVAMAAERHYRRVSSRWFFNFFIARWRKT